MTTEDPKAPNPGAEGENQEPQKDSDIKNLKSEMGRKFDNMSTQYEAIARQNEQLIAELNARLPQKKNQAKEEDTDLSDLMYDNPKEYARRIREQAKDDMRRELQQSQARQSKEQAVFTQLVSDYPELNNANSDLAKKAIEIYQGFDDEDKSTPVAYRAAVREAAANLGVNPVSQRDNTGESFALSGGSTGKPSKSKKGGDELDPDVSAFAQLMGLDTSDPKVVERLKTRKVRRTRT